MATQALEPSAVDDMVVRHVCEVEAIDVHTHLLPPTHGALLLYGIDELMTYHYLVAECFMVLPVPSEADSVSVGEVLPTPDEFFGWSKKRQAELIFQVLFVDRTPLSEACRGVVTTLNVLGLGGMLREAVRRPPGSRLGPLRAWFSAQDSADYLERIFQVSKLKYAISERARAHTYIESQGVECTHLQCMPGSSSHTIAQVRPRAPHFLSAVTNVPFDPEEAAHWMKTPVPPLSPRLKTALRVDPMLVGDWRAICTVLSA